MAVSLSRASQKPLSVNTAKKHNYHRPIGGMGLSLAGQVVWAQCTVGD